jgi:hypothetical protein
MDEKTASLLRDRAARLQRFSAEAPAVSSTALATPSPISSHPPISASKPAEIAIMPEKEYEIPGIPPGRSISSERYREVATLMRPLFENRRYDYAELTRHAKLFVCTEAVPMDRVRDYLSIVISTGPDNFIHYGRYHHQKENEEREAREKEEKRHAEITQIFNALPFHIMPDDLRYQYEAEIISLTKRGDIITDFIAIYVATITGDSLFKFTSYDEFVISQTSPSEPEPSSKPALGILSEYSEKQHQRFVASRPEGWKAPDQTRQKRIIDLFQPAIKKFGKQAVEELRWFQRPELESIPITRVAEYTKSLEIRGEREFWTYIDFKEDYDSRKKKEEDRRRIEEKTKSLLRERSQDIRRGERYIPEKTKAKTEWPEDREDLYHVRLPGSEKHPIRQQSRSYYTDTHRPDGYRIDGRDPGRAPMPTRSPIRNNRHDYVGDDSSSSDDDRFRGITRGRRLRGAEV